MVVKKGEIMKNLILLTAVLILSMAVNGFCDSKIDLADAKIVVLQPKKVIYDKSADMLRDEVEKRTRIGLDVVTRMADKNETVIVFGVGKEITKNFKMPAGLEMPNKADGYAIWVDTTKRKAATVCIAGVDERGAMFGVGRLLRLLDMSRDGLSLNGDTKIATAPDIALRGHQLGYRPKTNSYDAWTVEMWEQYYRDMIVFGMNATELIPPRSDDADDSPHLPKDQLEMMVDMSQLAQDYQIDLWIWFPAIDKDYTDKATVDAAIKEWGEVFRSLPKIDVVFVPGGDPGNTPPRILFDFMEIQKKNLNKYHPKAQLWMSPQGFDRKGKNRDGWLKEFLNIMQNDQPDWLGGVVFGPQVEMTLPDLRKALPAKYPIRRYPDITHCRSCQYPVENWDPVCRTTVGREPINPRPVFYTRIFRDLYKYSMGFITYSEGCNDDFNKVLWSCLGWDTKMSTDQIAKEYSKYYIGSHYQDKFAEGLFSLERNWVGPLKDNDGVYKTLELFQEMEENATPQDKLNWRFQQGLYRAYYDAYVKARLHYETDLEDQAKIVLAKAKDTGADKAMDLAEAILDRAATDKVKPEWRARAFEMAEALYQSIRMQLSVKKYQAIRTNRGANLDDIDKPLNDARDMKRDFAKIRNMNSEDAKLAAISKMID